MSTPAPESILPAPVLVVEDEPLLQSRLRGVLSALGYPDDALLFASTLAEARACLAQQPMALVLLIAFFLGWLGYVYMWNQTLFMAHVHLWKDIDIQLLLFVALVFAAGLVLNVLRSTPLCRALRRTSLNWPWSTSGSACGTRNCRRVCFCRYTMS